MLYGNVYCIIRCSKNFEYYLWVLMTEEYHELNKALLPRFTNKLNHTTEPEMNKN